MGNLFLINNYFNATLGYINRVEEEDREKEMNADDGSDEEEEMEAGQADDSSQVT